LKDKPFVLIGVNLNGYEPKKLKETMEKEKLTWRTFADPQSAINDKWNAGSPTYYVLDPKGVIRYKWMGSPGAKAIDAALEKLIQEAEGDAKKGPK
jgi:peroxiredoxin